MLLKQSLCLSLLSQVFLKKLSLIRLITRSIALVIATVLAVASTLTGCAALDTQQRAAIYRPSYNAAPNFAGLTATDEVVYLALDNPSVRATQTFSEFKLSDYLTKDNLQKPNPLPKTVRRYISAWWLPSNQPDAPTILYLHGVFRNLTHNHSKFNALRLAGFNVLAVTYRGWPGTSEHLPSEQSIFEDAWRGFEELKQREPNANKRLIYGHSMGGGVAVELASKLKFKQDYIGLMLESTFTSLPDVAAQLRWYGGLLRPFATQQFASVEKIKLVDAPVLIRHGTQDNTVPYVLGQQLFAAAPADKQFVSFEGGSHSGAHFEQPDKFKETAWQFWLRVRQSLSVR